MDAKQILSFIKIEHTLFSLPFVLIGYMIAIEQFNISPGIDLLWILLAAVGARGLAMALNRIIDRDIDAANPRTQNRHLASGAMSLRTAWTLAAFFFVMLRIVRKELKAQRSTRLSEALGFLHRDYKSDRLPAWGSNPPLADIA